MNMAWFMDLHATLDMESYGARWHGWFNACFVIPFRLFIMNR